MGFLFFLYIHQKGRDASSGDINNGGHYSILERNTDTGIFTTLQLQFQIPDLSGVSGSLDTFFFFLNARL